MTLVGFSLGARVIFKCLECLAETGGNGTINILFFYNSISLVAMLIISQICYTSTAGLVERVVLLGAPVSIKDEKWEDARKVGP